MGKEERNEEERKKGKERDMKKRIEIRFFFWLVFCSFIMSGYYELYQTLRNVKGSPEEKALLQKYKYKMYIFTAGSVGLGGLTSYGLYTSCMICELKYSICSKSNEDATVSTRVDSNSWRSRGSGLGNDQLYFHFSRVLSRNASFTERFGVTSRFDPSVCICVTIVYRKLIGSTT